MKRSFQATLLVFCAVMLSLGFAANAGAAGGGFVPGVEGVLAASIPPPGFHYKMHNLYYNADTLTNASGDDVDNGFGLKVFANVNRFLWNTGKKILGADYCAHLIIPFLSVNLDIEKAGISDSDTDIGDISLEPILLGWHFDRWDAAFGFVLNFPTGHYVSTNAANVGNGTFSAMFNLGATYWFDAEKTWSFSALTRTLFYGEQQDTDVTPGSELYIEWGLGKQFEAQKGLLIRPGICGYTYWQLSEDSGGNSTDDLGRVYAAGGEINFFWLNGLYQINARFLQEFGAEDEAEGFKAILTFIKTF